MQPAGVARPEMVDIFAFGSSAVALIGGPMVPHCLMSALCLSRIGKILSRLQIGSPFNNSQSIKTAVGNPGRVNSIEEVS